MTFVTFLKSLSCLSVLTPRGRQRRNNENSNHDRVKSSQSASSNEAAADKPLPLRVITLPHVLPYHQRALSDHGWTTITYTNQQDPLFTASQALLAASKAFFDLPTSYKEGYRTQAGTEEGWLRVEGEKEFVTLRSLANMPPELRDAAVEYWARVGALLDETMGRVAKSLGLPAEALTCLSGPCKEMGENKTATMLRLFRYEGFEGQDSRVVAEPHNDLGLLSLVIGDKPGLEVWDRNIQSWFPIERSYKEPAGTLLAGKQLERLTNKRYAAGGHLVRSYLNPPSKGKNYRYSIVFVLRAHSPVMLNTDNLTTPITGEFQEPLRDVPARELYRSIRRAHFNINSQKDEREQQRREVNLYKEKPTPQSQPLSAMEQDENHAS